MEYLLSHIEKLMNHLKHEASSKVKAYSSASKYDAELEALRNRNAILAQRNATRERVISELRVCVRACCWGCVCGVVSGTPAAVHHRVGWRSRLPLSSL